MALQSILKPGDTFKVSKSFGMFGSAATNKTPLIIVADNNNEPVLAQEVLINRPLVRMINVLASMDGFLKQRLINQKLLSENAKLTNRETQIEQKDFIPEIQVIQPDAKKVEGSSAGLLALGGLALLTLDPVQQALKDMFEGVSSMGKFVSGVVDSINNVFKFLVGNKEAESQSTTIPTPSTTNTIAPPQESAPSTPSVTPTEATPQPMATPVERTEQSPSSVITEKPAVTPATSSGSTSSNSTTSTPVSNVGVGVGMAVTAFSNAIQSVAPQTKMATPTGASEKTEDAKPSTTSAAGVVQVNHPETGSGWGIAGAKDKQGRPVAFSKEGADAFAKMMQDSGGIVKPSDVASSKRSVAKNAAVDGAKNSPHLRGIAMDIHGTSNQWIRQNGHKYGWKPHDYSGTHGGHFVFGGAGMTPDPGGESSIGQAIAETATSGLKKVGEMLGILGSAIIKPGIPKDNLPKVISEASKELNTEIATSKTKKHVSLPPAPTAPRINKTGSSATQNPATSADKNSVYYYLKRFGYNDLSTPESTLKVA